MTVGLLHQYFFIATTTSAIMTTPSPTQKSDTTQRQYHHQLKLENEFKNMDIASSPDTTHRRTSSLPQYPSPIFRPRRQRQHPRDRGGASSYTQLLKKENRQLRLENKRLRRVCRRRPRRRRRRPDPPDDWRRDDDDDDDDDESRGTITAARAAEMALLRQKDDTIRRLERDLAKLQKTLRGIVGKLNTFPLGGGGYVAE